MGVSMMRSLVRKLEKIDAIDLHSFGDASNNGVSAVVHAVVHQETDVNQGFVAAKARLAKKSLTILRKELVAGHMSANLVRNVKKALKNLPIRNIYGWLDSTVALHSIKGNGEYKQFVSNRVRKINEIDYIQWRYVPTDENISDMGSRGSKPDHLNGEWKHGPKWLSNPELWPEDISTKPTEESEAEAKQIKEVMMLADQREPDIWDKLMENHQYWRAIRIMAWVIRALFNLVSNKKQRKIGPLTTEEISNREKFWLKRAQSDVVNTTKFSEDQLRLNLQENNDGLFECRGRIQGEYPIYVPGDHVLARKLVEEVHLKTLHGGVGMTMAGIREKYWIPKLRRLAKQVIRSCHGCKKFQAVAFANPPPGNLPQDRTQGNIPFQVIGVDYAGPILYRSGKSGEGKAYVILYSCSLTRAVYLELLKDMTTEQFIQSFKRLVARKGKPEKVYSDNGKTFISAAKWVKRLKKSEDLAHYLAKQDIKWQFNLPRAPWCGGQFERLIGLMKKSLFKVIGGAKLKFSELEEVILDVEVALNNRPLSYVEDDLQFPVLTPNVMMFGKDNLLPTKDPNQIVDRDLRKRARYLERCKQVLWNRWHAEYI